MDAVVAIAHVNIRVHFPERFYGGTMQILRSYAQIVPSVRSAR